jgi:hypothetical protein
MAARNPDRPLVLRRCVGDAELRVRDAADPGRDAAQVLCNSSPAGALWSNAGWVQASDGRHDHSQCGRCAKQDPRVATSRLGTGVLALRPVPTLDGVGHTPMPWRRRRTSVAWIGALGCGNRRRGPERILDRRRPLSPEVRRARGLLARIVRDGFVRVEVSLAYSRIGPWSEGDQLVPGTEPVSRQTDDVGLAPCRPVFGLRSFLFHLFADLLSLGGRRVTSSWGGIIRIELVPICLN